MNARILIYAATLLLIVPLMPPASASSPAYVSKLTVSAASATFAGYVQRFALTDATLVANWHGGLGVRVYATNVSDPYAAGNPAEVPHYAGRAGASSVELYVKYDASASAGATFYVFYGDGTKSDTSDTAIFRAYQGFESASIPSGWAKYSGTSAWVTSTAQAAKGSRSITDNDVSATLYYDVYNPNFDLLTYQVTRVDVWLRTPSVATVTSDDWSFYAQYQPGNKERRCGFALNGGTPNHIDSMRSGGSFVTTGVTWTADTWYHFQHGIDAINNTARNEIYSDAGALLYSDTNACYGAAPYHATGGDFLAESSGAQATRAYMDEIIVRPYIGAEPSSTEGASGLVSVPPNPTAQFSFACDGVGCTFDGGLSSAAPGYPITSYAWTYGDGDTGTGQLVSHAYAAGGTYAVKLTVTDTFGHTANVTQALFVITLLGDSGWLYGGDRAQLASSMGIPAAGLDFLMASILILLSTFLGYRLGGAVGAYGGVACGLVACVVTSLVPVWLVVLMIAGLLTLKFAGRRAEGGD